MYKVLFVVLLVLLGLYGVYGPTPRGWEPKPVEIGDSIDISTLSTNKFIDPEYLTHQHFQGPEDTALDRDGNIYTGTRSGYIIRITPERQFSVLLEGRGQILGLCFTHDQQHLLFTDAKAGICKLHLSSGQVTVLVSNSDHPQLVSPNSITISEESMIYFTNTGPVTMDQFHNQLLYANHEGEVYEFNEQTGELNVLVNGLNFANGIAWAKGETEGDDCVYVAETGGFRVIRVFTKGEKRGGKQVVVQNINGYPDNLKFNDKGELWLALPAIRDSLSTFIVRHPIMRRILLMTHIPLELFLMVSNTSFAGGIKIDVHSNTIIEHLLDENAKIKFVTGINEFNGKLYLSSVSEPLIVVVGH